MSTMNYYVVLGIAEDADGETIRRAFRALARRYHPDVGAGSSTVEFQRALEAYETLINPDRRRVYDQGLRRLRPGAAITREPIAVEPLVEPLVRPRAYAFEVQGRRRMGPAATLFDVLFDELVASLEDDFWAAWRPR